DDFNDSVKNIIKSQKINAEYALAITGDNFSRMFAEMDDEYMQARSADVKDIAERVVGIHHGCRDVKDPGDEAVLLAAKDLAASEMVQIDKSKVLGFVTELGGSNSHTAFLARTTNIPVLNGIHVGREMDGLIG